MLTRICSVCDCLELAPCCRGASDSPLHLLSSPSLFVPFSTLDCQLVQQQKFQRPPTPSLQNLRSTLAPRRYHSLQKPKPLAASKDHQHPRTTCDSGASQEAAPRSTIGCFIALRHPIIETDTRLKQPALEKRCRFTCPAVWSLFHQETSLRNF